MISNQARKHFLKTKRLAKSLDHNEIYKWLLTEGYYPENYVLPPVFFVSKIPSRKRYYSYETKKYSVPPKELIEVHFPKSDLADRTFGIIEPTIHNDIAYEISENWDQIINILFDPHNRVYSYSFPISLDAKNIGETGKLRSGRMIYEFLEMAECDLIAEAYKYKYLVKTDIKNFYPSIYTHSIPWALHGKAIIRKPENRKNYDFFGNRLDKLFQKSNDECTNGIAIGPAISDLIAEIILAAVDFQLSHKLLEDDGYLLVRFKDDYRVLCKDEGSAQKAIKIIQEELKDYKLTLNEEKTEITNLPEGLFRPWKSEYLKINPKKGKLNFSQFQEFYLNVLNIDKTYPNTGVIDRFLADLRDKKYNLYIPSSMKDIDRSISLLLLLADRRIKAFPSILAIIEEIFKENSNEDIKKIIEEHLNALLDKFAQNPENNRYLITWIVYFLKSNKLQINHIYTFSDPIEKAVYNNRKDTLFQNPDFAIFRSISKSKKAISMIEHIDIFKRDKNF